MKKLVLAFLLFSINSYSQSTWIEQGANWHYGYWYIGGAGVIEYSYSADTIIQGKNCQKITGIEYRFQQSLPPPAPVTVTGPYTYPPMYTYLNQDTVFYLKGGAFYPMYIFSAQVGDTWPVGPATDTTFNCPDVTVKVVAIGDTVISGQTLRWLDVTPDDSSSASFTTGPATNKVRVIEKIGSTGKGLLFPVSYPTCMPDSFIWDPDYYYFRCFGSATISLHIYNDCDDLASLSESKSVSNQFSVFPNPSQGITNINPANSNQPYSVSLYDIAGKQLQSINGLKGNYQLETEALAKGLYVIRIGQGNKQYYHKLIIN